MATPAAASEINVIQAMRLRVFAVSRPPSARADYPYRPTAATAICASGSVFAHDCGPFVRVAPSASPQRKLGYLHAIPNVLDGRLRVAGALRSCAGVGILRPARPEPRAGAE